MRVILKRERSTCLGGSRKPKRSTAMRKQLGISRFTTYKVGRRLTDTFRSTGTQQTVNDTCTISATLGISWGIYVDNVLFTVSLINKSKILKGICIFIV